MGVLRMKFYLDITAVGNPLGRFTERRYVEDERDIMLSDWMRERIEECALVDEINMVSLATCDFDVLDYFTDAVDELRANGDVYGVTLVINGMEMNW